MKVTFVINPVAGRKRRPVEQIIRDCAGSDCEIRSWSAVEEIGQIVDVIGDDVVVVAAVGGDGTVHEVGKRLAGRKQALAVVPVGSGNGLARHLGISLDPQQAIEEIYECRIEPIDVGRIDGDHFLGVCGVGFDATVAQRFAKAGTRGIETYVREGLFTYVSYEPERYEITLDDESIETTAFLVAIANSGQYGNEARIAPFASLQDGVLDIAIVKSGSIVRAPFFLYQLFTGKLRDSGDVLFRQSRTVRVERQSAGPGHVDGEPVLLPATFECSLDERALNVCVPHRTKAF
ncbi:MAG: YegS/Rv2252/BmrU family lipid kinase [Thermoanaerobaculia bacterium]|nr:YegS/Rv2252/BmrU family lipid kinase [Thermoanaerobaculia bacterium]